MSAVNQEVLLAGIGDAPAYVYDLGWLRERCDLLVGLPIRRKRVFFATMANDHPTILTRIREAGIGVFVNSPGHLRLARELGFDPRSIVYAASNMLPEEMRMCRRERVNLVLDSIGQLQTFAGLGEDGAEIGVRLNVGSALDRGQIQADPSYRFGLLAAELPEAVEIARRAGVKLVGAHSYFGTGLMRCEVLLDGLERLGAAAGILPDLRYLDVGGGFGVSDTLGGAEFPIEDYAHRADAIMRDIERRMGRSVDLYMEPGRYLAAGSGYFFVKVVDCKLREDRAFVGTNGSVANFPRPLMYPEHAMHPCEIVGKRSQGAVHDRPIYICGNSTYSQDFLARDIALPLPEPGDTLVFHNAGAYGRSMITNFLGKERPREIFVDRSGLRSRAEQ